MEMTSKDLLRRTKAVVLYLMLLPSGLSISNQVLGRTPFDVDNTPPVPGLKGIEGREYDCHPNKDVECLSSDAFKELSGNGLCPEIQPKILKRYFPRGQKAAGNYSQLGNVATSEQCAKGCCLDAECHYSILVNKTCYLLHCLYGSYLCEPILSTEMAVVAEFSMILIRPPKLTPLTGTTCEVGEGSACKAHQKCIPTNHRSRNGVCICETDYDFDEDKKECIPEETDQVVTKSVDAFTSSTLTPPIALAVSINSRNVTLPENEVTLSAYVVPQARADYPYSYKWNLIWNPPDDTATVEGQNTDSLHLTGLKEGSYIFQVTAFTAHSNGSANATINVFPERKPNQAPVAVISPQEQSIQLPTSSVVLDASLSTDDDKIISYKWELQKGPILYAFSPSKSFNSSTLQVENLIPGNYTFKLTVEDSEHVTNSTTANITVIKEPDYPPTANPGKDIVIYLPQTEVVLNGNASTDDKKIVEWEWKATGDQNKAIDMQDTHTPYLKISHLQVGLYQFELKVTDEASQSSTATVHVVVKEPTGSPPKADAGPDQTTILNNQTWVIVDGSKSKSESNKITQFRWTQLKGPNIAKISPIDSGMRANISGMTKGEYEFLLTVEDESKLQSNSTVKINVIQRVNDPPRANAGGNRKIRLPAPVVQLDGSASTDDVAITSWFWERQPQSLAAGVILNNTDHSPILQIADLVPGKYAFKLTVRDEQGATDEDVTTLVVDAEPLVKDLIEIVLGLSVAQLTEADKNQIVQELSLLLHDANLVLDHIEAQMHSGNVVLQLHGEDKQGGVMNGSALTQQLKHKLYQDSGILQFPIYSVDTVLCLDECSGHGECQDTPDGRQCLCNVFWMENFMKRWFGSRERNCEWSKIYFGVVISMLLTMMFALIWSIAYIFRRNFPSLKGTASSSQLASSSPTNSKHGRSRKQHYTLVQEDEDLFQGLEVTDEDDAESEDSDSDILFESSKRSKRNGNMMMKPLTSISARNGILKNSRRIKA